MKRTSDSVLTTGESETDFKEITLKEKTQFGNEYGQQQQEQQEDIVDEDSQSMISEKVCSFFEFEENEEIKIEEDREETTFTTPLESDLTQFGNEFFCSLSRTSSFNELSFTEENIFNYSNDEDQINSFSSEFVCDQQQQLFNGSTQTLNDQSNHCKDCLNTVNDCSNCSMDNRSYLNF